MKQIMIRSLVALMILGLLAGCANLHDENYYWCVVDCTEPEEVAPEPAPEPEPAPVPEPEPADNLDWLVDVLFPLDSANLEVPPEGIAQLDKLARKLEEGELDPDRIVITGHADRIGDAAYNEDLSMERAEAVRDYLLDKGVAVPMEIRARGQQDPVVTSCPDDMPMEELIDCLQPNRRVSIDLVNDEDN